MAAAEQRNLEGLIRGLLASERDVNVIEVPAYYNFGRQVARCKRNMKGIEKLNQDIAGLVRKWTAAGARESVLIRILKDLFAYDYTP
jgi:hypothetical protein